MTGGRLNVEKAEEAAIWDGEMVGTGLGKGDDLKGDSHYGGVMASQMR